MEGRKAQDGRSVGTADENATGSVFLPSRFRDSHFIDARSFSLIHALRLMITVFSPTEGAEKVNAGRKETSDQQE